MKREIVAEWARALPKPVTVIFSLLGRKPDGRSEFRFYPFFGAGDSVSERSGKRSFDEWLAIECPERRFRLVESPTADMQPIPEPQLRYIAADVLVELYQGQGVVIVDSGGVTRTGQVVQYMGAIAR